MFYIADLHVHSHYSRATSKNLNLESLYQWARVKGIHVVGTGDFTHPRWFQELREKLEPDGNGLFRLKNPPREPALPGIKVQDIDVRFCLTTEISSIYKYGDKVRKNHNLVYAPDFDTVARINARLSAIGNLASDGRPILGLPSRDLLEIVLEASASDGQQAYLVPAHVWTPWFSTLGSKGGYDSVDECFRDLTGHIFAVETGLSSDPEMNWKWSALDRFTLISSSDAHSPQKLGREANLFDAERSYEGMFNALKNRKGFLGTYEFFPEEGKYHHDGHRKCGISLKPEETLKYNGICPQCGRPLTIGVLNRVESLADRDVPKKPEGAAGFHHIIPLPEILAEIKQKGPGSKTVMQAFHQAISAFGNEFSLLKEVPVEDIQRRGNPVLAEAVRHMRQGEVNPVAGYDGLYGVIKIFKEGEMHQVAGQAPLFGDQEIPRMKKAPETGIPEGPAGMDRGTPGMEAQGQEAAQPTAGRKNGGAEDAAQEDSGNKHGQGAFEQELNESQQRVKETLSGTVLVKAGPGTGKTSTLIQWIAGQIRAGQAQPGEMLAITFTNKAASEIRERLGGLLGDEVKPIRMGTFHAVAYRMLQERFPGLQTVYDEESRLSVIRFLFPGLQERDHKKLSGALARLFELQDETGFDDIRTYATRYREYAHRQGAIDLSDILGQVASLWKQEPGWLEKYRREIRAIAVDEFQDINALQYEFLQLLGTGKNLLAIGDPDQAIYGFRGSDVRLFFRFTRDFQAKEISLTENYRSTATILKAAGSLIQYNTLKSGLRLNPSKGQGLRIKSCRADDTEQEARYIAREIEKHVGGIHLLTSGTPHHAGHYAFSDIAVLFRTHAVGRELITHLKRSDIPLHLGDGSAFLSQSPFSLIADILRLHIHSRDLIALHGILDRALGWEKPELKTFLSRLHEEQLDWQQADPVSVSRRSRENFLQWIDFYEALPDFLTRNGVEGALKEIFGRYLPDSKLSEDQLLKKETILTLAREAQADVHRFLEDNTLNNYTDTGRQHVHGIRLLTFHAAKGLEFPVVFIAGAEEGITPSARQDTDPEEERRLFYVALTRAKEELHITMAAKRRIYGTEQQQEASRFIREIPAELLEQVKADIKPGKKNEENQLSLF